MALPSLEHQIAFVDAIVVARASKTVGKTTNYYVAEVIKSRSAALHPNSIVNADLTIFDLLGYSIDDGQLTIVFLAEKASGFDCIDFLPVKGGSFEYGIDDMSVYRKMTLDEFRRVAGDMER